MRIWLDQSRPSFIWAGVDGAAALIGRRTVAGAASPKRLHSPLRPGAEGWGPVSPAFPTAALAARSVSTWSRAHRWVHLLGWAHSDDIPESPGCPGLAVSQCLSVLGRATVWEPRLMSLGLKEVPVLTSRNTSWPSNSVGASHSLNQESSGSSYLLVLVLSIPIDEAPPKCRTPPLRTISFLFFLPNHGIHNNDNNNNNKIKAQKTEQAKIHLQRHRLPPKKWFKKISGIKNKNWREDGERWER